MVLHKKKLRYYKAFWFRRTEGLLIIWSACFYTFTLFTIPHPHLRRLVLHFLCVQVRFCTFCMYKWGPLRHHSVLLSYPPRSPQTALSIHLGLRFFLDILKYTSWHKVSEFWNSSSFPWNGLHCWMSLVYSLSTSGLKETFLICWHYI